MSRSGDKILGNSTDGPPDSTPSEQCESHWRYEGYPGFSKWMASSGDFLILRRFSQLNIRVLLLMQHQIVMLSEELEQIDHEGQQYSDARGDCSSLQHEPLPHRLEILDQLKILLKEYNEYVCCFSEIRSWKSAQDHQVENVENWAYNHEHAIDAKELEFIRAGRDVVALVRNDKSPLRLLLEKFRPIILSNLFRTKTKPDQAQSATTNYYSNARLDASVAFIIITTGLLLLLGPMWWLQFVRDEVKRLGIITGFVLLFTSLLASTTVARPFEVLAATAAYSAVLMS
ncbi:hypothetical protein VFPPC_10493 [Pochonia chlamydosporia 170]|uniref:DUF6594 domain-containing protein n=1 Tax=Pochonia chlamydosporia 170 TaxID=1380566 RepID=A0A179F1V8_METCM|nr:hypothetical protein VFPPC_10493 [Pochonia chlamydosporia 170]OAQ59435.1 hypothetical protein VFPPC_10493 [Pochonia chlamydosporia 170]